MDQPTRIRSMMDVAPTVSSVLDLPFPRAVQGVPIPEIVRDLHGVQGVALLVLDAFGWYAWTLWQSEMPFLRTLMSRRSLALRSVLPSITPVNFSTMVTGTDLDGHSVRTYNHDFACETLFDVVRMAGGRSAAVGFEGYTGGELLARYADIPGVTRRGSDDFIVDTLIEIVERYKPAFLIAQYGRVDDVFHQVGPSSPEVVPMLRDTDGRIERSVTALERLGYGTVILADHGQHDIDDPATSLKGGHGSDRDEDCLVPCTWR